MRHYARTEFQIVSINVSVIMRIFKFEGLQGCFMSSAMGDIQRLRRVEDLLLKPHI